jgi:hypothetical protein
MGEKWYEGSVCDVPKGESGLKFRTATIVSTIAWSAMASVAASSAWAQGGVGEQCASAFENGQKQRDTGKLQAAEASFLVCAQKQCPGFIARDCSQFREEVQKRIPSFVPAARSNGRDLTAAKLSLDGVVVAERLDGRPVFADPGRHVVRFEEASGKSMELSIVLAEGEKLRRVVADFEAEKQPGVVAPGGPGAGAGAGAEPGDVRTASAGTGVWPWVAGGATLAVGGLALGFFVAARGEESDLLDSCGKRPTKCTPAEISPVVTKDTIALTLGIVAAVGAVTTVVLFALPSSPAAQKAARYMRDGIVF